MFHTITMDSPVGKLRLIAGDRARHVAFAWAFLGSRVPALDGQGRAAVTAAVSDMLTNVILAGYRNTWLLPEKSREPWLAAEAATLSRDIAEQTAEDLRAAYPVVTGELRGSVRVVRPRRPRVARVVTEIEVTARHAEFFEFGTVYTPPRPTFVPIARRGRLPMAR